MSFASLPRRYPLDSLVVLLAVVAEIKVWFVPRPRAEGGLHRRLAALDAAAPAASSVSVCGSGLRLRSAGGLGRCHSELWGSRRPRFRVAPLVLGCRRPQRPRPGNHRRGDRLREHRVVAQLDAAVGPSEAVVGIVIGGVIWLIAYRAPTAGAARRGARGEGFPARARARGTGARRRSPLNGDESRATSTT